MQPLQGKSLQVLANPSPSIEAYEGAVRSGKTITSLFDWVRFILHGPAGALAMCGRTERTVINNLILPLQEIFGPERIKINYGTGTTTIMGREVFLYGANNEQARTKIQGLTLAGAYVDEGSTIPESFFNMLYSRLSVPGAKLWLTANPEGPTHWLKKKWLDRARLWINKHGDTIVNDSNDALDLHRYTFLLDDNPSLDPVYVERLKRSYTGVFKKRFIESEWVLAEGTIYSNFDETKHVIPWDSLPAMERIMCVAVDYGTMNPSVAIVLGHGRDGRLYALNEWSHGGKETGNPLTDKQLADKVLNFLAEQHAPDDDRRPEVFILDPSAKNFSVELVGRGQPVMGADNDVKYGIRTVASLLGGSEPSLIISDRCKRLIGEMPAYVWDEKAYERDGEERPLQINDHACDALRYAVVTTERHWRPIMDRKVAA